MKKFIIFLAWLIGSWSADAVAAGRLTIFIWSEYIDPGIIASFEREHDIKVRLEHYDSNEEMLAKLNNGGLGQYDIIVPSTYAVPNLKDMDLLQPLNHNLLPNLKNIDPAFTQLSSDPNCKFTVPYQWGTSGLAVRHKDVTQVQQSWKLIFSPGHEIGSFIMFDNSREALATALKFQGYSINTINHKEIESAARLLAQTRKRPSFLEFSDGEGGLRKIINNIAAAVQVYSGEAIKAQEKDPNIHYLLPAEGCEIWADVMAVAQNAPNKDNAHLFINYILDAKIGARLATYNRYGSPNAAAKKFLPEEDLNNPTIYPSDAQLRNMEYIEDLGNVNSLYDEAWIMITTQ